MADPVSKIKKPVLGPGTKNVFGVRLKLLKYAMRIVDWLTGVHHDWPCA